MTRSATRSLGQQASTAAAASTGAPGGAGGLSGREASARLLRHGPNRLPDPPRPSEIARFLKQFANPLVVTLVIAAAVAVLVAARAGVPGQGFLARYGDAAAIVLIVALNAALGYFQERRARAALDALRSLESPRARVRRDGTLCVIDATELVPGDLIEVEAGDAVPADARLVWTAALATSEAALTGESLPAGKDAAETSSETSPLGDRTDRIFLGTTVARGKGRAIVVATGARTELGKIGAAIAAAGDEETPLERRLATFGKRVLLGCLAVSLALFAWGVAIAGRAWHTVLLEAVSFAVAVIPEGLPAITTITLALGMQRMAKRGAIVRRLPAVETLGAATVLCVDKTGTLTQNAMTVVAAYASGLHIDVSGSGYDPSGALSVPAGGGLPRSVLGRLAETALLCNGAELSRDEASGAWRVIGDPMEGALLVLAEKIGASRDDPRAPVVRELPFDSARKRMTVVVREPSGRTTAHTKGSVEALLPLCSSIAAEGGDREMLDGDRERIAAAAERFGSAALRVLLIARKDDAADSDPEARLTFLGLVGLIDPPRSDTRASIEACRQAGIRVVMITGDHVLTATAIARDLGLWQPGDGALTGEALGVMSDEDLARHIKTVRVFARSTPEQKLRIVKAFKSAGEVVAMTGDGVNDAPALREAHIGVAMGRGGTDVARQAADLVIVDDRFATIVEAIREGRAIYRNIQKVIFFLLSSNAGLSVAVFAVSFSGLWTPLTPLMILWINLVTNGLPALALGVDPPDAAQMSEPPRRAGAELLGFRDYLGVAFVGVVMGGAAVYLYAWPPPYFDPGAEWSRAMAFSLLAVAPLFHAWSSRSPTTTLLGMRPVISRPLVLACLASAAVQLVAVVFPALRPVFHTHEMTASHWLVILSLSAAMVAAVETAKAVARRARGRVGAAGP